jgi:hypothetical protein
VRHHAGLLFSTIPYKERDMRTIPLLLSFSLLSCAPQEPVEEKGDPQPVAGIRFTDSPRIQRGATWSPDGSQILFVSITMSSDIWIADVSGVIAGE